MILTKAMAEDRATDLRRDMCPHAFDLQTQFCVDCASPEELRAKVKDQRSDLDELMEYVDAAKRVAQRYGRWTGEPLSECIQRLMDENNIPETP